MLLHDTPESIPTKQCTKCREWKPATPEYFHRKQNGRFGLRADCKVCHSQHKPTVYVQLDHKHCPSCGQDKPATNEFFATNKTTKSGFKSHCKACVSARRDAKAKAEYDRLYREENRERIRNRKKQEYEQNRERYLAQMRKRREDHREEINQDKRERHRWRIRNDPAYRSHYRAKALERFYRQKNAEGSHSKEDVTRQYKAQKGLCYYCGCELNGKYHEDHVIPLSRGGSDGIENIVVTCERCNRSKGAKLPSEWDGSNKLL